MNDYETNVRRALFHTIFFLIFASISFAVALVCSISLIGHALKIGIVCSSAAMTISILIAQNRHAYFKSLLKPNTFATSDFISALQKYRKFKSLGDCTLLLLGAVGVLIGIYGSLAL